MHLPTSAQWSNPSIERTAVGKPVSASHIKH
jgi:hypothetical protein